MATAIDSPVAKRWAALIPAGSIPKIFFSHSEKSGCPGLVIWHIHFALKNFLSKFFMRKITMSNNHPIHISSNDIFYYRHMFASDCLCTFHKIIASTNPEGFVASIILFHFHFCKTEPANRADPLLQKWITINHQRMLITKHALGNDTFYFLGNFRWKNMQFVNSDSIRKNLEMLCPDPVTSSTLLRLGLRSFFYSVSTRLHVIIWWKCYSQPVE